MEFRTKRILVADGSKKTQSSLESSQAFENYDFMFVFDGESCKEAIASFQPDLILLELFLPKLHGIQLLKWMKNDIKFRSIGVIMMTYELMLQNYRASLEFGAEYFLERPFKPSFLFLLFEKYFTNTLQIEPFPGEQVIDFGVDSYFNPKIYKPTSYLKFWGTRGSISVSGQEYVRTGGNTSCLEIRDRKNVVIIDSGTGIRPLGEELVNDKKLTNLNLLISHTHQDHVVGFPFFNPLYMEKTKLNVWSPIGFEKTTEGLFTQMLAYSFFPVRLDQMHASVKFCDLHDSMEYKFGDITICCCYTYHPGPTLGFKIKMEGQNIGYVTDNELLVGYHGHPADIPMNHQLMDLHSNLIEFLSDCDTIIHEAQYFPNEYEQRVGWGHSSITNATAIFKFLNCKHWIVTHHDPRHTDEQLALKADLHRQILDEVGLDCRLTYAYDGMIFPIRFKESN
ncbi:MAG: MBL fold metallo-hydrolase [Rhabdochlamydiaceae bacterium]|nr:MBL fold metallo-hydrolase [Candidatus Amphrikana amoebophyrae]